MGPLNRRIAPGGKCAYYCECCGAERTTKVHTFVDNVDGGGFGLVADNASPRHVNNYTSTDIPRSLVEEYQPG